MLSLVSSLHWRLSQLLTSSSTPSTANNRKPPQMAAAVLAVVAGVAVRLSQLQSKLSHFPVLVPSRRGTTTVLVSALFQITLPTVHSNGLVVTRMSPPLITKVALPLKILALPLVLGIIGIIYSGYLIMTARDNEAQVARGKRRILEVVIGLLIWALAAFIINLVLPSNDSNLTKDLSQTNSVEVSNIPTKRINVILLA